MNIEIATFEDFINESLDTILACVEGLDGAALNWRPDAARSNTLFVIANHSMANAERNVLATFCGEPYDYDRDAEFAAAGDSAEELIERWAALRVRIEHGLQAARPERLTEDCTHFRLGVVPGRTILLRAARHVAEHVSEAPLTRALLNAAGDAN